MEITNGSPPDGGGHAPPLRVAIVGAGIAGLAAALSLRRFYPPTSVQVTLYEQAAELREVGASIGLNPSGLRVLDDRLGVRAAAAAAAGNGAGASFSAPVDVASQVGFRQPSGRPMVYRHWRTGEEIGHDEPARGVEARHRMARFHRAHLQRALAGALPGDVEVRLGVRAQGVRVERGRDGDEGGVVVSFEDGSSAAADLLIGADGIHSKVRRAFAPGHELRWTGMVALRAAFDYSLVRDIKGLPEDAVFWVGHERTFFASRLGKNQYAIVGSYNCDPNDPKSPYQDAKWDGPGDVEFLRTLYRGWNPVVEAITNAVPYVKTYPNHAGTALSSLVFENRVALLGDAAHTHGGAFAAGGSLAINDAYALARALAHVWPPGEAFMKPTRQELGRALGLYDETRRPLVTRLLNVVHGNAQARRWAAEKRGEDGEGETDAELRIRIANRPDMSWLTEHDVDEAFEAVLARRGS